MAGNPMTPWTPRERALRAALEGVMELAKEWSSAEMSFAHPLSGARESDAAIAAEEALETHIDAALAEQPPPDPRDEALRLAITALETASIAFNAYAVHHAAKGDEVKRAKNQCLRDEMDAAIRAAKGGS